MTPFEANVLLTKAALADPRNKPTADRAEMWAEMLADVNLEDALAAMREHLRHSTDPILPAHVIALLGVQEPSLTVRDIQPELEAQWKAEALAAAGVTEAEYQEHEKDIPWLRAHFQRGELE